MSQWLGLIDKVCIVSGAGGGIGASVAEHLARAGARVALLDKNITAAQAALQNIQEKIPTASTNAPRLIALACDVADPASVQSAVSVVENSLGSIWGLVNNAGFLRAGSLKDVSLDDWNAVLQVNLTGYLLLARACMSSMLKVAAASGEKGGAIVHVASIAANFPQTHSGAYSASKAGVVQLSRQMAVEWGEHQIRSNVICPGMIRTPLSAEFYKVQGVEAKRAAMTASKRVGEAQDIAQVALFLLSPRSGYVNATEIAVDGGMPAMLMDMVPRPGYNM
jgi:glucose 1-dehydrogenase